MMLTANDSMYAYYYTSPDLATAHEQPPLTEAWDNAPNEQLLQLPTAMYAVLHPGDSLNFVRDPRLRTPIDDRVAIARYPIDYSYLLRIKTIPYAKEGDLKLYEREIEGRAVFVGDTHDPEDARMIPTERVPVPGVMVHAAAFATMNLELLHDITGWKSIAFEALLILSVWVVKIFTLGRNPAHRPSRRWNPDAMEIIAAIAAAGTVVLVSTTFLWLTRFFWPDFLWIATGLFLDPYFRHIKDLVVAPGLKGSVRHAGPA
jgi:hypothetical protein